MNVTPIKTQTLAHDTPDLFAFLDKSVQTVKDHSVLVVTSKVISIVQGKVVGKNEMSKTELVEKESEYYLDPEESKYQFSISIKNGLLVPSAGIDESNADGQYILWPENPQEVANSIREYLCKRFSISSVGVLITDSTTRPLRWGTTGVGIAYSGFEPLKDYIGENDLFGRKIEVTKMNIMDGLSAAAVVAMGEGAEQTPLALIEDVSFITFVDRNPTKEEVNALIISKEEDLYEPLLTSVQWKKGKQR